MKDFKSNEEFFAAFRDLVSRMERGGARDAASLLREGFACLNGLTDGWVVLMEAMEKVIPACQGQITGEELRDLKEMLRVVRKTVYR